MKKLTIGLFIDTYYPMIDGVVTVVDNYAKVLSKYANVYVFAPKVSKDFDDNTLPYKVVRCKSIKAFKIDYVIPLPKLDRKFRKELKEINPDIIHIHSPAGIARMGARYAKKHKKVLVGTIHSQYKKDFLRATKSKLVSNILLNNVMNLFRKCDKCYTVNEGVKKIVLDEYKFNKSLFVTRNATTMKLVEDKNKSREKIKRLHNIKDNTYIFLFVGRLNKLKNIFLIVDALKLIDNKINYKMLFVGNGQDEKELHDRVCELNLEERIVFCGKVTDRELLRDYYASSDLFLFPSLYDASSVVQVEAASQKLATLFLEMSATSSNIKDNHNGFLSGHTKEEYANRIIEIINDKELLKEVSSNAYKELYITWEDEVKKIYDEYNELMKEK